MKICGLIVEYNPFHNGHLYHVEQAKKESSADVVIAVMSGNFLQRGEPALIDKWRRAREAVKNGVDLVIELPVEWSVQSADFFSKGALKILEMLGCDSICFGTDGPIDYDYESYGKFVNEHYDEIQEKIKTHRDVSQTYAQKMIAVLKEMNPLFLIEENQPNHILALSYAKENARLKRPMKLIPISRKGATFHSINLPDDKIASATAIRRGLINEEEISDYVPDASILSRKNEWVTWESLWSYLRYQLTVKSPEELREIYQMVDGLEFRFKKNLTHATSFSVFIESIATKRYSKVRLQRLCLYVLLNVTKEEMDRQQEKTMLRPLAYNEKGRWLLKELPFDKENLVSRFAKEESEKYPLTLRCDQVYQLANEAIEEQNFGRYAIVKKKS